MSTTNTAYTSPTPTSVLSGLDSGGSAQKNQGITIGSFLASLAAGLIIFGVELGVFIVIHGKFTRIYAPRTFLVPERERTQPPPKGIWQWLLPIFRTNNSDFIQKCGLDAYFFLRYLRTLLKIFIPCALLILPILIPVNVVGGRGADFAVGDYGYHNTYTNVTGLDTLAWGNVRPTNNNRYWTHLILAITVIAYTCSIFFDELRNYIRLRQAYLTSPQHRLRASATTVLVTAIPTKWCTFAALDGLYDVYPGGIRNIWINRNFDDLSDKVKMRGKYAQALESAETNLIRKAKKESVEKEKKAAKKAGKKLQDKDITSPQHDDESALAGAQTDGISSGDPHQTRHTVDEAMEDSPSDQSPVVNKPAIPIPVIGEGINAVGHGFEKIGKTVLGGFKLAGKDVDDRLNTTGGFVPDESGIGIGERRRDYRATGPVAVSQKDQPASQEREIRNVTFGNDLRPSMDQNTGKSDESTVRPSTSYDDTDRHQVPGTEGKAGLGIKGASVDNRTDGVLDIGDVINNPERIGEEDANRTSALQFWKRKHKSPFGIPSPTPHGVEEDEFPLSRPSPMTPGCNPQAVINGKQPETPLTQKVKEKVKLSKDEKEETKYASALEEGYDPNEGDAKWKEFVKEKDRDTMRLPIFGWQWMPSLPLLGHKVDTINFCRNEIARLNLEIEEDQKHPEKYPLMNSAFIQFNHQVAAHMACQAVSHHTPQQMAPRIVEISPDDVIWDNMSITWWESYLRTGGIVILVAGLIVLWAVPVTFTGLLSNITYLTKFKVLDWILRAPTWFLSIVQGVLPQALLALLLYLLPVILRLCARLQGNHTGMGVQLSVQAYYFSFLFIQVFLVVSIASGITSIIPEIAKSPGSVPSLLAQNLPKASNYFFSYLLLQALSVSAGALVQIGGLVSWFILAPLLDSTARQKWKRQLNLPNMQWGTFFPVYTNLACIGLIYSVISPLMMLFNIITFSLFWLVYRYNTLYVTKFRFDTGGLLYPRAINQLFTGLYVMELVMIGLFLLVRDVKFDANDGHAYATGSPCFIQAIIMIVVLGLTVIYQFLLTTAFGPLLRYLPITLEDEAVMRDEEFARAQEKRWAMNDDGDEAGDGINHFDGGFNSGRRSPTPNRTQGDIEMTDLKSRRDFGLLDPRNIGKKVGELVPPRISWADKTREGRTLSPNPEGQVASPRPRRHHVRQAVHKLTDTEAQQTTGSALAEALFAGINDEIEDLTSEERDRLVQRAFLHEALRARRPVIWIPRDDLGVSDDEVRRTQKLSKYIWISNEYTGLDKKQRVIFRRSPPDFSELDLIEL